jgi:Acyl-CoA reductase (LuxC)
MYRTLSPEYEVWGDFEHGIVIRSEEPVEFHPEGKVVNVVAVEDLEDAFARVNVATQTIGIYPPERSAAWRDRLAARGMQRIVPLGEVIDHVPGMPHDGFFPLHRFVRWMVDDC